MSDKETVVSTTRDVLWAIGAFVILLGLTVLFAGCCSYAMEESFRGSGFKPGAWKVGAFLSGGLTILGGLGFISIPWAIISVGHFTMIDELKQARRDAESSLAQAEKDKESMKAATEMEINELKAQIARARGDAEATRIAGSEVVELLGEIARRWEVLGKSDGKS